MQPGYGQAQAPARFPPVVKPGTSKGSEVGAAAALDRADPVPLPSDSCRAGTRMECFESS